MNRTKERLKALEEQIKALDRLYNERTIGAQEALKVAERVSQTSLSESQLQTKEWLQSHNGIITQMQIDRNTFVTKTEFMWLIRTILIACGLVLTGMVLMTKR